MRKFTALASFVLVISVLVGAGCSSTTTVSTTNTTTTNDSLVVDEEDSTLAASNTNSTTTATNINTSYTMADVEAHASETDCWLVINSKVYDVTSYIPQHPGGDKLITGCGKDATAMFGGDNVWGKVHSGAAKVILSKYEIGQLTQ